MCRLPRTMGRMICPRRTIVPLPRSECDPDDQKYTVRQYGGGPHHIFQAFFFPANFLTFFCFLSSRARRPVAMNVCKNITPHAA